MDMASIKEIFCLAGETALPSETAETNLLAVERRIACTLPGEFREFYSMANAQDLLKEYSNSDWPMSVAELAKPMSRWRNYDPIDDKILPFMNENQGVCVWGVRLDRGDDPPVVVEVDSGTPPRWQLCAERFTDWLEFQVDHFRVFESLWFVAQAPALTDDVLRLLRGHFEEGLQTHTWPGETNYLFFNARCELALWSTKGQCDWWIAPRSADVATAALDEIEEIAGIGNDLYAPRQEHEQLLRIWRESKTVN
jgi:hypothetical protein